MEYFRPTGRRSITPQKAVNILSKHGIEVTEEEGKLILNFLYNFAKLSVEQAIRQESGYICPDVKTPRKAFK